MSIIILPFLEKFSSYVCMNYGNSLGVEELRRDLPFPPLLGEGGRRPDGETTIFLLPLVGEGACKADEGGSKQTHL